MVEGIKSQTCKVYWVFVMLCFMIWIVFLLFQYQLLSKPRALRLKSEPQSQPYKVNKQKQQPQLPHSTMDAFLKEQSEVQLQRHKYIQESCANHPHLNVGAMSHTTKRQILVVDKHRLLYCFIPKAGCTNWKAVLMVMDGYRNRTDDIRGPMAHDYYDKRRLSSYNQTEQKYRLETYTKFTVTRHPFERALSAYRNKFANMDVYRGYPPYQKLARYIMKKFRKNATPVQLKTGENITWVEWVSYLTKSRPEKFDVHWMAYFQLCSPCKINYDYFGKLDTISNDSEYIQTKLGIQKKVSFPSRETSLPYNSSDKFDNYMSQLSQEQLRNLWEVYRLDFELFGYPKPNLS